MNTLTFSEDIEGSRGTIVFGNGIPSVKVEILRVSADHIIADIWDAETTIAVPVSAIAYYRFAGEND